MEFTCEQLVDSFANGVWRELEEYYKELFESED